MTALEIILLIAGVLCVVVSFLVKDGNSENSNGDDEQIKELTEQDRERIRKQINEVLEEEMSSISEKTEAQLDKISNTKILEMNDYAETIMGEINRNHNETVFLYDMLNEKAKEVKSTVKDVNIAKREVAKMQYESTITSEEPKAETPSAENKTSNQANGIIESGAKSQRESTPDTTAYKSARTATAVSQKGNSKDLAKERLIELVRKSTENSKELQRSAQLKVEPLKPAKQVKKTEPEKPAKQAQKTESEKPAEQSEKTESEKTESEKPKTTRKRTAKKPAESENINVNIQFDKSINKNEAIIDMYKQGMSNKEIAKQLSLGIGEVKLVIDLFKNTK